MSDDRNTLSGALDPVLQLMATLRQAGHDNFRSQNDWESCLCALILAFEPRCKTFRMLEALPYRDGPYDQLDTLNAFSHLGYFSRPVGMSMQDLDSRLLPCLFVTDSGKPMVILEDKNSTYKVYRQSSIALMPKAVLEQESGTAWLFERFDENRQRTSKFYRAGSGQSWFRALLARFKGTFWQVFSAGLFLNILALTTPLFIMLVYDRVISVGSIETLPMLVAGVSIAIVLEYVLRRVRSQGLSWLAARMDNIVSNKIFSHLVGLPPAMIEKASVAAQIARIRTFESVRDFFSGSVFLSMLELPFVVLAALAIFTIAGPLVIAPLAMVALYGLLFWAVHRKVKIAIRLAAKASSARQQFSIETFEKVCGVRAYGLTHQWHARFRDLSGKEMLAHFHLNWLGMIAETLAHSITLISAVAVVGFGAHFIWAGSMTSGALVASMILVWRILTPFYSLCTMIPRLEQLRNSIIQVNKLMDIDTEAMEARTSSRLATIRGKVEFNNTSLRYDDKSDDIFSNLTFEAQPGDLIVVTGENGAGKTSLLKMVKNLYQPRSGSVLIDGFDIRQLDAPDYRRQIAYVPQHADFFKGSIAENLRLGNPIASIEDIEKALSLADALEDVRALPKGIDTIIDRYGDALLPANLLTRLSLARAYLYTAPILLLDEIPNTLLSGQAGKNLKEYLGRIKGKRTIFMVTYRDDFIRFADTIILMRQGINPTVGPRETMIDTLLKEVA